MNILIVADYRTPNSGNFIASLLELGERLRREHGNAIFLFPEHRNGGGYSWSEWLEQEGFRVYFLKDSLSKDAVLERLGEIIRENKIELVHSHFGLYHGLLIKNGKKLGVKVLFHDHMDYVTDASERRQRLYTVRKALAYAAMGIGVISVMEKKHKDYWLCPRKWYIPNGLSLRRNVAKELPREERRIQLGIAAEQKLCLFLGWDMYRKGLDIAVQSVNKLREADPTWHLGLVGFSDTPSDVALKWIKEKTGISPVNDWIHFFASSEDMYSYHRSADVYLSASRAEAFSYGILEAISQNTPVVISDIEGTAWAQRYDKCITFPAEDSKACADALRKAYSMRNVDSNCSELMEKYGIDIWCKRVIDAYRKMLKK